MYLDKRVLVLILLCVVLAVAMLPGGPGRPQETAASGAPRGAVLDYLTSLAGRTSERVIVGQFGFYGDAETPALANDTLSGFFKQAGQQVGMTGYDLNSDYHRKAGCAAANNWLVERWRQGMLVTVSWHAPNPFDGAAGASVPESWDFTGNTVEQLYNPSLKPAVYQRWVAILSAAADCLQGLADAGVVVIFRPFHEVNGAWFWWHQQTPSAFSALWRSVHAYLTQERGLDNLLWGFSPNAQWDKWSQRADYFYPGGDYVDIVGLDYYAPRWLGCPDKGGPEEIDIDTRFNNQDGSYTQLAALRKPMGLFEFGPSPASASGWNDPANGCAYDYAKLLRDIGAKYPQVVFFQAWEWVWAMSRHNAAGVAAHPLAITLNDLPRFTQQPGPTPGATQSLSPSPTKRPSATPTATRTPRPTTTPLPSATIPPGAITYRIEIRGTLEIVIIPSK